MGLLYPYQANYPLGWYDPVLASLVELAAVVFEGMKGLFLVSDPEGRACEFSLLMIYFSKWLQ